MTRKDELIAELQKELNTSLEWVKASEKLPLDEDDYLVSVHHPEAGLNHRAMVAHYSFSLDESGLVDRFDIPEIPYDITPYVEAWFPIPGAYFPQ